MHQQDASIATASNVRNDAVIINQCDREETVETVLTDSTGGTHHVKLVSTQERGLSRSRNMAIAHATADMGTESYNAKGVFTEGGGRATFDALYNGKSESYTANLDIKDINVHHFMPKEAMYTFSGNVEARGKGTDVYSAATHAEAKAHISKLHYDKYHLDKIDFNATYANNHYKVSADTDNKAGPSSQWFLP